MEPGLLRNNLSTKVTSDEQALALWNDGVTLIEQKQSATAIAIFERLAEQNYEQAAKTLGRIYENQQAGAPNLVLARKWYEIAIRDENCMDSRISLARLLLRSHSVDDIKAGLKVLDDAVELGDQRAKILKAFLLDAGMHLVADKPLAEKMLTEAAQMGYVLATRRLAHFARRQHRYIASLGYFLSAFLSSFQIAKQDRNDQRLWGWGEGL